MLKRKIEKEIDRWIEGSKKGLLVYGVRQCGKTSIIRECLERSGYGYVEFNLIENPEIVSILDNASNTEDLIMRLSLYSERELVPGHTILFFDEIQRCVDIVTRVKFLVEDGRFKYVFSGSLLGVLLTNLRSAPVGYLEMLSMYPMDFEEFLQVFHFSADLRNTLEDSFRSLQQVPEDIHRRMLELFRLYLIIGGMPAAVQIYCDTGNIDEVIREHQSITETYKLDFTQYEQKEKRPILTEIYDIIPAELNEKNKRFKIADISKNLRYERLEENFVWLWKAGVALPAFNVTEPMIPLLLNEKHSLFKLFLSDIGLLTTSYGKALKLRIINGEADINRGSVYENAAAQELAAHGFKLWYFNSKKQGELDFVVEDGGRVLPIEIKSGKDYEKHSALRNVLANEAYGIDKAYVFCDGNISVKDKVIYLPVYMLMFLNGEDVEFADIRPKRYRL